MEAIIKLYSTKKGEITKFLNHFYGYDIDIENDLEWKKEYQNPIELASMIGALIENQEDFDINMWISMDTGLFINVTQDNADDIIRYLYERFPY